MFDYMYFVFFLFIHLFINYQIIPLAEMLVFRFRFIVPILLPIVILPIHLVKASLLAKHLVHKVDLDQASILLQMNKIVIIFIIYYFFK
jgi:hypothetical protein